jgi:hypothetical protein
MVTLAEAARIAHVRELALPEPADGRLCICLKSRGAAFAVRNTTAQNNALTGIAVGGSSSAELMECAMRRNVQGLDVYTGSTAILKGAITITEPINRGSAITCRPARARPSWGGPGRREASSPPNPASVWGLRMSKLSFFKVAELPPMAA